MEVWATQTPEEPYFDSRLNSWIFSRHKDVAAALRESRLIPVSARSTSPAVPVERAIHAQFRSHARRALTPMRLRELEEQIVLIANKMADTLPAGRPVDLVEQYARPWSLEVAGIGADVPADHCEHLSVLARRVFEAAAEPYDAGLEAASQKATVELARFFDGAPPLNMQMFIALAHSLPSFLTAAWLALLQYPAWITRLREDPELYPRAMDELLRFAGPSKAQFRQAITTVAIDRCTIQRQQRVILRLDIANRDPEHFPAPNELRFDRRAGDHLAFGTGPHACVATMLIRSAAAVATKALIDRFDLPERFTAVPADCFAVRYLKSLIVLLKPWPVPGQFS